MSGNFWDANRGLTTVRQPLRIRWYSLMQWEFMGWFRYISYYFVVAYLKQENGFIFVIGNITEKEQSFQNKT